jgi:hypothetical protein
MTNVDHHWQTDSKGIFKQVTKDGVVIGTIRRTGIMFTAHVGDDLRGVGHQSLKRAVRYIEDEARKRGKSTCPKADEFGSGRT